MTPGRVSRRHAIRVVTPLLASRAMRRILAALALVAVAVAVAGCAGLGGGDDVSLVPEDERSPAPAFRRRPLDGSGEVALADYAGTPVVLNFWASWCEPCQGEMPALVEFAEATGRRRSWASRSPTCPPTAARSRARPGPTSRSASTGAATRSPSSAPPACR